MSDLTMKFMKSANVESGNFAGGIREMSVKCCQTLIEGIARIERYGDTSRLPLAIGGFTVDLKDGPYVAIFIGALIAEDGIEAHLESTREAFRRVLEETRKLNDAES